MYAVVVRDETDSTMYVDLEHGNFPPEYRVIRKHQFKNHTHNNFQIFLLHEIYRATYNYNNIQRLFSFFFSFGI